MMHNYEFLATGFSGLGNMYRNLKEYDKALYNTRKCLIIRKKLDEEGKYVKNEGIFQAYHNLGNIHLDLKNVDSAEYFYKLSDQYSELAGDNYHKIYIYQGYGDIAEIKGDWNKMLENYLRAYQLATSLKSNYKIYYLSKTISDIYAKKKDYEKALEYMKVSVQYKDSSMNLDNMRELGKAEVSFDFKLKSSIDSVNYQRKIKEEEDIRIADAEKHDLENAKSRAIIIGVVSILIIVLVFSVYLIKLYRDKKKANEIIAEQQRITESHLEIIEEKQKEIVDSINYAKRIQIALLANSKAMKSILPEHFVFFQPKDIVSGDFYWFTTFQDKNKDTIAFLAICDSTGHGVPGAFMSLLNMSYLNEAINEKLIHEPHLVLNHVRERLIDKLKAYEQKDGFDGILLKYNLTKNKISYAAANNMPILLSNNEYLQLPYDRMPVGVSDLKDSFQLYEIDSEKHGILYLTTDGIIDQFGGDKGKKLKNKGLKEMLDKSTQLPMEKHTDVIKEEFNKWRGNLEQLDDVCLMGIKI